MAKYALLHIKGYVMAKYALLHSAELPRMFICSKSEDSVPFSDFVLEVNTTDEPKFQFQFQGG